MSMSSGFMMPKALIIKEKNRKPLTNQKYKKIIKATGEKEFSRENERPLFAREQIDIFKECPFYFLLTKEG
jgi:hypothetical protein